MAASPLSSFTPRVREWFTGAFAAPTEAQAQAWPAIATGEHVADLGADRVGQDAGGVPVGARPAGADPLPEGERRTRLVYVSPLKALAYDIERNLRAPLAGASARDIRVGAAHRRHAAARARGDAARAARRPDHDARVALPDADEQAREILRGVEAVIVDEIHAVAGTKRGAHLALTLERLDALAQADGGRDVQRIGLSATQNPLEEVGRFMVGPRRSAASSTPACASRWT